MANHDHAQLIDIMLGAALEAGAIILDIYQRPIDAQQKSDGSPVTEADEKAEKAILAHLAQTGIPVLAEESAAAGHIPDLGDRFFVVDPLDGTKEFIKRNGEFTVNIALVENGQPTLGVVTAPARNQGYLGSMDGAFRFTIADHKAGPMAPLQSSQTSEMKVVASRSHGHAALEVLCADFLVQDNVSIGSSLKFCLVADGQARFYPRFTPTCEWDTAAGHAVLRAQGGCVLTLDGSDLAYGKTDTRFLNPYFIAADTRELADRVAKRMQKLVATDATL
jgi:3'(2'), 5'-bisphosphate nucleotidase